MKKIIFSFTLLLTACILSAQVTVGSELSPNSGALLDIKEFASTSTNLSTATKGVNLPRVALQAANKLEPCATSNTANNRNHTGMFVYNTTTNAELTPGVYYWNGVIWMRMITELPKSQLNLLNLQSSTTTEIGTAYGDGGAVLDFGTITIPDDGSFAFNFRLYGSIGDLPTGTRRVIYYFSLWVDGVLADTAEINVYATKDSGLFYTYSVALGCSANAGQKITFKMSHRPDMAFPWSLVAKSGNSADRTSMIWWKL